MRRNILLKKRIGCLLAAALLAGEIGSASMVAVAAPLAKTQTSVENQVENSQEVVDLPEEYITFGEPVVSEPDVKAEELDAAKAQSQEEIQEEIPVIRPVAESETESLDAAKAAQGTDQGEVQEEIPMIFPESIPVLGGDASVEKECLEMAGESGEFYDYPSISVNDVISVSGHDGVFENQYYLFTPDASGYYGIYVPEMDDCNLYIDTFDIEHTSYVFGGSFWVADTYVYGYLEGNKTYKIVIYSNNVGTEYSFAAKWIAIDKTDVTTGANEVVAGKEQLIQLPDRNALYKIKLQSENGFDYTLKQSGSGYSSVVLKNGEENFFFYEAYNPLCLNKNVAVEDQVEITLEKVTADKYDSNNNFQKVKQCEWKKESYASYYSSYYSFLEFTPDEDGTYAFSVEKSSGFNAYSYDDDFERLESYYVNPIGNYGGYLCTLEADRTYYFLVSTNELAKNGEVLVSITRMDYIEQEVGTSKIYNDETRMPLIPLTIPVTQGKGYKITVEKESDEQYDFCSNFRLGSYNTSFSDTKTTFSGMLYEDELKIILAEYDTFEQSGKVTVKVEEYEIPQIQKEKLYYNQNEMSGHEFYVTKTVVDETAVYELSGINYTRGSYVYIYKEIVNDYDGKPGLDYLCDMNYYDSFNMKVELEAGKTYYIIDYTYSQKQPGDFYLYLTDPKNYEMDLSDAGEEAVSCEMELLKSAEISVKIPESGFYELSANGGEEHYEVSCSGMDSGLALYENQSKLAYFDSPGTYTVRISREFLAEDMKDEAELDEVTFTMKKSSNVNSLPVYDGTEATEFEVTLREENDYNWFSFTPEKDGCYSVSSIDDEYTYGDCDTKIYELQEDHLQYIFYSNLLYELEGGKTYYVKLTATDTEGAHNRLVFLENPIKELTIDESEVIQTRHGALIRTNLEESGIYELTLVGDVNKKTRIEGMVNGSYYSWTLAKNKKVSKTFYLGKGELEIALRKINNDLSSTSLTITLQKMNVQEGEQDVTMDKQTVWVKYTPTETHKYLVSTSNATYEIGDVLTYYESDGQLYETSTNCTYENNNIYGIFDFKKDVTYFLKIESYELPNQFSLHIKPVNEIQVASLANNEVNVKACTQIQYDEQVTNGFYEIKVTENTSPLTIRVKNQNYEYTYQNGINGGSGLFEVGRPMDDEGEPSDVVVTLYNFSGEETDAKVSIEKIEPVEKEISFGETFTRTVEGLVEIYTFTPEVSGSYTVAMDGITEIEMCQQGDDFRELIEEDEVRNWEAGKTYYFYMIDRVGTKFSLDIQQRRRVFFYDYNEYSAFIASGGTITLMNSDDVSDEQWEDYYNDYSDIKQLGDDKVLVLNSQNFKNMNDRWYPGALYSQYVNSAYSTYGDIQQYVKTSYRRLKYEGLYNEALKKVNASDTMTNPHVAVVKYVPEYVAVQRINLSGPTVMKVGDTVTLQAVLDTMNEYTPTNATVTWSSSNSNVIAVNANGEITAKAPGTSTITVKSNDKLGRFASIKIDVYQDVVYAKAVTISGPKNVYVGDSIQLAATVTGQNNATPTVNGVTWTTSDTKVARVDANGKVTGLKQGTVTITATSKDGKAVGTYTISVQNVIEKKITLNESKITMKKGTKYTWLKVTFKPENTTDKSLDWESNNKKVVTVNDNGVLTAKGIGKATITVTSANGKKAKVNVTVTKYAVKVKKVSTTSKKTIMEGEKVTLPLEVTPVNATNQKMKWKSSNEDVATVSSKGVVTAKKAGKATITVTAQDGSKKSAKCVVTVKELSKVKSVKVKSAKKKTVEISWASVEDADGYAIYMATEKNGKYKKIATTKKDVTSYTKTKLKSKKTYYFKICAIRKVGKKQYEGKLGKAAKVKVK